MVNGTGNQKWPGNAGHFLWNIMKRFASILSVLLMLLVFITGCRRDNPDQPEGDNYTVYRTEVSGFSGLCYSAAKNSFYAVSDNGNLYETDKEGNTIRNFGLSGNNDFEAISFDTVQNRLYLADEALMNIYWLTPGQTVLNAVTHITINGGISNKGIEGLSFGRDTLYIVNQESPKLLIKYSLSGQAETSRIPVDFAAYLSDIFFDASDNSLWICDSQQKMIFHCTVNGELLASQDIHFVPKAEALVIDRADNSAWVGCDQSSGLYKIKLKI